MLTGYSISICRSLAIFFTFSFFMLAFGTRSHAMGPTARIHNPQANNNIMHGSTEAISGDFLNARSRDPQDPNKWIVNYPKVRIELWFQAAQGGVPYRKGSTEVSVTFPDNTTTVGAWSGSLTCTQLGTYVNGYYIRAFGLDPTNAGHPGTEDEIPINITRDNP